MIRWLKNLPKPIGIMAANDACGLRVLEACRAARLVVPEEISVIGVDDDELLCSLCHPPLSSIGLATVSAGYRVAQTLHALMLGQPVDPLPIVIPPSHVIPRDSTATAFALDARVEKARRFILKQARQDDPGPRCRRARRRLASFPGNPLRALARAEHPPGDSPGPPGTGQGPVVEHPSIGVLPSRRPAGLPTRTT